MPDDHFDRHLAAHEVQVAWRRPPELHIHERQHEFFRCVSGQGQQYLDQGEWPVGPGDLHLLPAGHRHLCGSREGGMSIQVMYLSPAALPVGEGELQAILTTIARHTALVGPALPLSPAGAQRAGQAFQRVVEEMQGRAPGHRASAVAAVCEFLVTIRRDPVACATIRFADEPVTEDERIADLCRWMADTYRSDVGVPDMIRITGLPRSRLHTAFRRVTGTTPRAHLERLRLTDAQRQLRDTRLPITDIALSCGFTSLSRFYAAFTTHAGCTPRDWRAGGKLIRAASA